MVSSEEGFTIHGKVIAYTQVFVCCCCFLFNVKGVGLGRVVREVRLHPEDHRFESQRWQ
jgi:hypothetical protein